MFSGFRSLTDRTKIRVREVALGEGIGKVVAIETESSTKTGCRRMVNREILRGGRKRFD